MRILLTEGAGLTSRQVATQLDQRRHEVAALISDPLCLARFTRHLESLPRGPQFGEDPLAWFDRMVDVAVEGDFAVVFPTQEQVTVLSHQLPRLVAAGLATAVPPFSSLLRVQDKVSATHTLSEFDIPQPRSQVITHASECDGWTSFPAYVKASLATGSTGVRQVTNHRECVAAVDHFLAVSIDPRPAVLVQAALEGTFVMAQCIFDAGSLVAMHVNERTLEGANGSAAAKSSVVLPSLQSDLSRLGQQLQWHGALSVDAIVADGQAHVIDVNPRLVEPGNALAAGTDLVGALLAVACGSYVDPASPSRPGIRTHQLLMSILGTAQHAGTRRRVLVELARAIGHRGVYRNSREELLPLRKDWRAILPMVAATVATLLRPKLYGVLTEGAVSHYSLSPAGWRQLCQTPALQAVTPATA